MAPREKGFDVHINNYTATEQEKAILHRVGRQIFFYPSFIGVAGIAGGAYLAARQRWGILARLGLGITGGAIGVFAGTRISMWRAHATLATLPPSPLKSAIDELRYNQPRFSHHRIRKIGRRFDGDAREDDDYVGNMAVDWTGQDKTKENDSVTIVLHDARINGDHGKTVRLVRRHGNEWTFYEEGDDFKPSSSA
eukprot:jgi/Hompol1/6253/HPOL_004909-RA